MSGDIGIGRLIDGEAFRDAIHVAVAPVTANEPLVHGQDVGFAVANDYNLVSASAALKIGIIDPFLKSESISKGDRCYVFLYPGSITSLRHEWTHPAFSGNPDLATSIQWLKSAAVSLGVDYSELVSEWSPLTSGDYINNGENIRDIWCSLCDDFWKHRAVVTGADVAERDRGGFTCSC